MKDINFLVNESQLEKGDIENKIKSMTGVKVVIAVFIVTIAVGILFVPGLFLKSIENQISQVEKKMTDVKYSEVRRVKAQLSSIKIEVNNKKAIINGIDKRSVPASQVFTSIEASLPAGCYISKVTFKENNLKVSGVADNSLLAAEFFGNLDRLHMFTRLTNSLLIEQALHPIEYNIEYIVSENGG